MLSSKLACWCLCSGWCTFMIKLESKQGKGCHLLAGMCLCHQPASKPNQGTYLMQL